MKFECEEIMYLYFPKVDYYKDFCPVDERHAATIAKVMYRKNMATIAKNVIKM